MTAPTASSTATALSVAQAAAQLGVGIPTLRRMIARRQIAHVRLNRRVTLLADDIRDYLAAHRVPAARSATATRVGQPSLVTAPR